MKYVSFEADHKEYADYVNELRGEFPDLANAFGRSDSLENVLDWMGSRDLANGAVDIVGQDEFSYDFLIQLDGQGHWLVFGVN
jgi:hypothetical protein